MRLKAVKLFGGLGATLAAGIGALFMKCPVCWMAIGSAALATYWPLLLLPGLAIGIYVSKSRTQCTAACGKSHV